MGVIGKIGPAIVAKAALLLSVIPAKAPLSSVIPANFYNFVTPDESRGLDFAPFNC
jgi:hypothetical protein